MLQTWLCEKEKCFAVEIKNMSWILCIWNMMFVVSQEKNYETSGHCDTINIEAKLGDIIA